MNCPVSCDACHLRDSKMRCQRSTLNISDSRAFTTDSLEHMFSSLKKRLGAKYGSVKVVSTSPWIVIVDESEVSP